VDELADVLPQAASDIEEPAVIRLEEGQESRVDVPSVRQVELEKSELPEAGVRPDLPRLVTLRSVSRANVLVIL
jgi:hypothetical protein